METELRASPSFPTPTHARAAEAATRFLAAISVVDGVLLIGSCARRNDGNDLDICALVTNQQGIDGVRERWAEFARTAPEPIELAKVGQFVELDLDITDGNFAPRPRGWTTGPDGFELVLGNYVAHSVVLWERDKRVQRLRERWLPYYDDELRKARLTEARMYCLNDLHHVPLMTRREEPFNAFHRLYLAFQGFLQCLFITRRSYPIAYDKWIRDQVEGLLGLPDLYRELQGIIGVQNLELRKIEESTAALQALFDKHVET